MTPWLIFLLFVLLAAVFVAGTFFGSRHVDDLRRQLESFKKQAEAWKATAIEAVRDLDSIKDRLP